MKRQVKSQKTPDSHLKTLHDRLLADPDPWYQCGSRLFQIAESSRALIHSSSRSELVVGLPAAAQIGPDEGYFQSFVPPILMLHGMACEAWMKGLLVHRDHEDARRKLTVKERAILEQYVFDDLFADRLSEADKQSLRVAREEFGETVPDRRKKVMKHGTHRLLDLAREALTPEQFGRIEAAFLAELTQWIVYGRYPASGEKQPKGGLPDFRQFDWDKLLQLQTIIFERYDDLLEEDRKLIGSE